MNEAPITITADDVKADPFPHAVKEGAIRPDLYRRLRDEFPPDSLFDNRGKRFGARTGRDLYKGDRGFEEFIEGSPAWREFHDYMNSPAFLEYTLDLFATHMERYSCRIQPPQARLVDFVENRMATWWRARKARWLGIRGQADPNELFIRFDIEQSKQGYRKPVHCDNASRLVSFLVYFCDADELEMQGGDLGIHEHLQSKELPAYERAPREEDTRLVATLRPKENLGIFFLCSNNSYHSVTPIESMNDYRRFIYTNVSSRADIIW